MIYVEKDAYYLAVVQIICPGQWNIVGNGLFKPVDVSDFAIKFHGTFIFIIANDTQTFKPQMLGLVTLSMMLGHQSIVDISCIIYVDFFSSIYVVKCDDSEIFIWRDSICNKGICQA